MCICLLQPHGVCLSRTSTRTILLREWKPCLWVLENNATLFVFRDAIAYRAYHENPFLDAETKAYLLKVRHTQHFFVGGARSALKGCSAAVLCLPVCGPRSLGEGGAYCEPPLQAHDA